MSVEWTEPAIVLDARPYGEGGAVATVLTEGYGRHKGLAKGGSARGNVALWQPGNLIQCHWMARLSDQLGAFTAELVHPGAALAMDDAFALGILSSACAVAEGALPEREAHPRVFGDLLRLITRLGEGRAVLPDYIAWEDLLLRETGYGMDLQRCAATGATEDLIYVSPRTGRAVSASAAEDWKDRLLPLPGFLRGDRTGADDPRSWADGLRLTGHFLERDAFGLQNKALPQARVMLADRVQALLTAQPGPATQLRDGIGQLSPIQRRLLEVLRHQKRRFRKCMFIIGTAMQDDISMRDEVAETVYAALEKMLHGPFPLIEAQGTVDAQRPETARSSEVRLTDAAQDELDKASL